MSDVNPDNAFDQLVHRSLVPKGYRPKTDTQIAQMLDTIGGVPVDDDKLTRMLQKVNGQLPLGQGPQGRLPGEPAASAVKGKALRALHRQQGSPISAELRARVEEVERRAAGPADDSGAHSGV